MAKANVQQSMVLSSSHAMTPIRSITRLSARSVPVSPKKSSHNSTNYLNL